MFSAALHVALLGVVEPPVGPAPQPRAALTLSLAAPTLPAAARSSPPAPAAVAKPAAPAASVKAAENDAAAKVRRRAEEPSPPTPFAGKSALELARALTAGLADVPPAPPREGVVRLTDAPARPDYAYYLEAWRRQVERVGKLNYPAEARRRKLTGSLRLLVVIRADGGLLDARLVESSGHAALDEAALRIVRLAAPYAPFPPRIAAQANTLEIERTWRFQGDAGALL